jgi:CheY-like chemotaxis protein
MDGLDICRFLKKQFSTSDIPVIIISATVDIHQLAKAAGADAFIEKPFDIKTLLATIAEHIAKHEAVK